ncbi:winged helix-turn-helix domain-containing protein [Cytobacillus gottheilii]|uniref:winged helix-turn-helix domain-containing protein n=1 Tax=Cytobacillus gottheilii TaxID=859144 RepID=UPI000836EB95|nr:winged helix-turn-helix domain-containing protein [Cytobacillus gottheilii]
MIQLQFQLSNYCVKKENQHIHLLRKEFYLLQFLYDHANQPFTREQLLDAVWPMEMPSDRTVDDHIYRLRKKIKPWENDLKIETIKGFGYQLNCKKAEKTFALSNDEDFQMLSQRLLSIYHLYGHGEAIEKIIQQSELGIAIPSHFHKIIAFMKGDIWSLIDDHSNIDDNLYFLINIFQTLSHDYQRTLHYNKTAIQKKMFSGSTMLEAKTLGLLTAYIMSKDFTAAKLHIEKIPGIEPKIMDPEHGYFPFLMTMQLTIAICEDNKQDIKRLISILKRFFEDRPYKREMGIFNILEGSYLIKSGHIEKGRLKVENGFDIIKQSHFTSHLYYATDISLFLLNNFVDDPMLYKQILTMRSMLIPEQQAEEAVAVLKKILDKKIGER